MWYLLAGKSLHVASVTTEIIIDFPSLSLFDKQHYFSRFCHGFPGAAPGAAPCPPPGFGVSVSPNKLETLDTAEDGLRGSWYGVACVVLRSVSRSLSCLGDDALETTLDAPLDWAVD